MLHPIMDMNPIEFVTVSNGYLNDIAGKTKIKIEIKMNTQQDNKYI